MSVEEFNYPWYSDDNCYEIIAWSRDAFILNRLRSNLVYPNSIRVVRIDEDNLYVYSGHISQLRIRKCIFDHFTESTKTAILNYCDGFTDRE